MTTMTETVEKTRTASRSRMKIAANSTNSPTCMSARPPKAISNGRLRSRMRFKARDSGLGPTYSVSTTDIIVTPHADDP